MSPGAARSFSQALLVIVVPLYVSAAGYSTLQVGYLLSLALAGSTGMTLIVGVLSDRYGRKPLLIAIAALAAIGSAVYALTTQFWVLALMAAIASIRGGGGGSAVAVLPGLLRTNLQMSVIESYQPVFWIASLASLGVVLLTLPIRETPAPPAPANRAATKLSTRRLIGRLWLTNGINGFVIGIVGPFLTYWLALRYGAGSTEIAALYLAANLLTALSYIGSPGVAHRLGAVRAIVLTRLGTVVLMAAMALAPTFFLASVAYTARVMVNSLGMPIRQSFVMGIAEEQSRSRVAAIGSLPSQATGMVAPTIASHLMQSVSEVAPIWLATAAMAVNAGLFELFFKNIRPPEEE